MIHRLETIREASIYGIRPKRVFREAATRYLLEKQHNKSIKDDACRLELLDKFIGNLSLEAIHMGTLQAFIEARRKEGLRDKRKGVKNRTINHALKLVGNILKLAASKWKDEYGLTWLASAPIIDLLPEKDARKAYPLNWEEQETFFSKLPLYLRRMALFKVNTGLRDQEVCQLKWEWEYFIPELQTSVFIIPGEFTKNGMDRLVVLNRIAKQVVEEVRNEHATYVFTYARRGSLFIEASDKEMSKRVKRHPIYQMNNKSWQKVREETGIPARVHDLKHTFGRRLRSAGVSFEDRQDLLGHKSARITTHYSAAEVLNLIEAANKICVDSNKPGLTLLRVTNLQSRVKVAQQTLKLVEKNRAKA